MGKIYKCRYIEETVGPSRSFNPPKELVEKTDYDKAIKALKGIMEGDIYDGNDWADFRAETILKELGEIDG